MASLDQNAIASTTSCADHHLHRHLLISPCTEVRYVYQLWSRVLTMNQTPCSTDRALRHTIHRKEGSP